MIRKDSFTLDERRAVIEKLDKLGCVDIYLLHNIYHRTKKNSFIFDRDFSIFATYSRQNLELHVYASGPPAVNSFTQYLKKNPMPVQFLGTTIDTAHQIFEEIPSYYVNVVSIDDYYSYVLLRDRYLAIRKNLVTLDTTLPEIQFRIPVGRNDILALKNLQQGYFIEEMEYPSFYVTDAFVKQKLAELYKYYKVFYLVKDGQAVSKCEWNAYTDRIFQIGGVYTERNLRRTGLGYHLMIKMLDYSFGELGMEKSALFVRKDNVRALNLYRKLGFTRLDKDLSWTIFKMNR